MESIKSRYTIQQKQWYVVYTKSRQEKKVAERLLSAGFEVYCPLVKVKKVWSDRLKTVEEPLLKSYCFVKCTEAQRSEVRYIPGIVQFLHWLSKPATVKDNIIEQLRINLGNFSAESIQIDTIKKGERIVVKTGVFKNQIGETILVKGTKLTMLLEQLGIKITIDTSINCVETKERKSANHLV